jgi:hypothetical protein
MNELSKRIYDFLDKYAGLNPNYNDDYDDIDEKYTSPDASMLKACADMLNKGLIPKRCWSEWSSGGYKPYTSKLGNEEHDSLIKEINEIINKK